MDEFTSKIESKTQKIKKSLLELINEISVVTEFLFRLKENSAEMVENLNNITTPEIYFKKFIDVNAFILKYLNFLTEVNCKFEMLEISEKECSASEFFSKADKISENISQTNSSLNCVSTSNLNLTKMCEVKKTSHNLNSPKEKKTKRKNKNSSSSVFNNNFMNRRLSNSGYEQKELGNSQKKHSQKDFFTWESYSKCENNNLKIVATSNDENENLEQTKLKVISSLRLKETDSSSNKMTFGDNRHDSQVALFSDNSDSNNQLAETFSDSKTPSHSTSSNTFHSSNVQRCEIQLVTKNSHETINHSKFKEYNQNSGRVKDFNSIQNSDKKYSAGTKIAELNKKITEISDIKPPNIIRKLGKEYDVIIKKILSPSEFYVSFIDAQLDVSVELEKKLKLISETEIKHCDKKINNKKSWLNKLGKYALFYSICDETWFRAEIINKFLNFKDVFVTIFLLDCGETKCVSFYDLQPMPDYFKAYPASVQRCHLHGILPFDVDHTSNKLLWDPELTDLMISLTENCDKIKIKVAFGDHFHPDTSLPVTLFLVDKGNQCVNQLLTGSKYAIPGPVLDEEVPNTENSESDMKEKEILKDWNPMKEDYESYLNSYDLDINDPAAVIYGYVGNDYKRICPQFAKSGYCFKGLTCKKEHEKLDPSGFTTDKEEIYYDAFNNLIIPPSKTIINVEVTCFISFNQFYCISKNIPGPDDEDFESLFNFMNSQENVMEMKKLLIPPSIGQIVIAQYPVDYYWYRARILESQPEKDLYKVLFTDYGNSETLPLSCIRAIGAQYLHLPFQAMHCIIAGIDPNPEIPLETAVNFMYQKIHGNLIIEVISKLPGEGINLLVNVFDEDGRNIGNDVIEQKYGIYKKEILISSDSESIPG